MVSSTSVLALLAVLGIPVVPHSLGVPAVDPNVARGPILQEGSGEELDALRSDEKLEMPSPIVRNQVHSLAMSKGRRRGRLKSIDQLPVNRTTIDDAMNNDGQSPTQSEVQLRRALRQKRRKLKRLWQEIKDIQRALKAKTDGSQTAAPNVIGQLRLNDTTKAKGNGKTKKRHWRRRIMQRLKMLSRLLREQQKSPSRDAMEKLDALLAALPSDGRSVDEEMNGRTSSGGGNGGGFNGRRKGPKKAKPDSKIKIQDQDSKNVGSTAATPLAEMTSTSPYSVKPGVGRTNKTVKHKSRRRPMTARPRKTSTVASRTVIKKGEDGSSCTSHKNCKPGFCCHQLIPGHGQVSNSSGFCQKHRLSQGEPCANSCQCDNELQCFISRKDRLHHKRVPAPDPLSTWSTQAVEKGPETDAITAGRVPSGDGQCKIPAMDDVLHGVYIMAENSIFKVSQEKFVS